MRAYYKRTREKRLLWSRMYYKKNRRACLLRMRKQRLNHPEKSLFNGARWSARRRGILFRLRSWRDVPPIPKFCSVLGIRIKTTYGRGKQPNSPSLDRIYPKLGYRIGNIQVISWRANNNLKNNATPAEMILIGKYGKRLLRETK